MAENFTLTIFTKNGSPVQTLYTSSNSIIFGSGLHCNVRIRDPSIERSHLQVFLDRRKMIAFGSDVYLNDTLLDIGNYYDFSLGDKIRIHNTHFNITKTESNAEISEGNTIKPLPQYLAEDSEDVINVQQTEIVPDLYPNGEEVNEVNVTAKIIEDDKGNKETIINRDITTNEVRDGAIITKEITEEIYTKEVEGSVVDNSIVSDVNQKETSTLKSDESGDSLKAVPEIQHAVKILEDGPCDINVEMALEEGDLPTIKEAITLKKEDLNTEIRDAIQSEVTVSDTPIDPSLSKKVGKDLGPVVIGKEILTDAEKIVDEKINEDSKQQVEETKPVDDVKVEERTVQDESVEEHPKDIEVQDETFQAEDIKQEVPSEEPVQEVKVEETKENNNNEESNEKEENSASSGVEEPIKAPLKAKAAPKKETVKKTKAEEKSKPVKKEKKTNANASILMRTPRRAASQAVDANSLLTPIAKRSKRNSEVPAKKNNKTKK